MHAFCCKDSGLDTIRQLDTPRKVEMSRQGPRQKHQVRQTRLNVNTNSNQTDDHSDLFNPTTRSVYQSGCID